MTETLQQRSLPPPPFEMPNRNSIPATTTVTATNVNIKEEDIEVEVTLPFSPDPISSFVSPDVSNSAQSINNAINSPAPITEEELEEEEKGIMAEEEQMHLMNQFIRNQDEVDEDEAPDDTNGISSPGVSLICTTQMSGGRRRFFSIDVDGELDDMSSSLFASCHNPVSSSSSDQDITFTLPPLETSSSSPHADGQVGGDDEERERQLVLNSNLSNEDNIATAVQGGTEILGCIQRDRGLSLDFLTFGMDEEHVPHGEGGAESTTSSHRQRSDSILSDIRPRLDSVANNSITMVELERLRSDSIIHEGDRMRSDSISSFFGISNTRPRGDSIIFDPTSFKEGGIHEETARNVGRVRGLSFLSQCGSTTVAEDYEAIIANSCSSGQNIHLNQGGDVIISLDGQCEHHFLDPEDAIVDVSELSLTQHQSHHYPPELAPKPPIEAYMDGTLHQGHHINPNPNQHSTNNPAFVISAQQTLDLLNKGGRIGIYLPDERRRRIAKFHLKRQKRIWKKRIKYDCRKKLADSRPRIKGRFVKRGDVVDGL